MPHSVTVSLLHVSFLLCLVVDSRHSFLVRLWRRRVEEKYYYLFIYYLYYLIKLNRTTQPSITSQFNSSSKPHYQCGFRGLGVGRLWICLRCSGGQAVLVAHIFFCCCFIWTFRPRINFMFFLFCFYCLVFLFVFLYFSCCFFNVMFKLFHLETLFHLWKWFFSLSFHIEDSAYFEADVFSSYCYKVKKKTWTHLVSLVIYSVWV